MITRTRVFEHTKCGRQQFENVIRDLLNAGRPEHTTELAQVKIARNFSKKLLVCLSFDNQSFGTC